MSSVPPAGPETFTMPVELGKVCELLRATGGEVDRWTVGTEAPLSPPTFLAAARLWHPEEGDGDGASSRLHAAQSFTFPGAPPRVGDVLTGASRVTDRYQKQGRRGGAMTFTEVTTEFRDEAGRLVATAVKTTVVTARAPREEP